MNVVGRQQSGGTAQLSMLADWPPGPPPVMPPNTVNLQHQWARSCPRNFHDENNNNNYNSSHSKRKLS